MKDFIGKILKRRKGLTKTIWLPIMCLLLSGVFLQCKVREKPENLEGNLKNLCREIPPDFKQKRSPRSIIKYDGGTYSIGFSSTMTYDEVKNYYSKRLLPDGWKILEESSYNISDFDETKYLTYRKDGYDISIETANLAENDSEKIFSVTCGWKAY